MSESFPSEKLDKFVLRLPSGMRDRIKTVAADNGRSMNAEIVKALAFYLSYDQKGDFFVLPTPEDNEDQADHRAQYVLQELRAILSKIKDT